MNGTTISIKTPISRDDLDMVISGLEAACPNARIEVTECFDLVVQDERQADALKALFSQCRRPKSVGIKPKKAQSKIVAGPHSYIIETSGEVISTRALNIRLAEHDIAPTTRLTHSTKGRFVVVDAENESEPYTLTAAGEWEPSHD
jgi:hypothetical protein